ncbi:hypothetical protein ABYF32_03070 [Buchananella felis]|uniref:hypothetical protein n=1 Tax=Buchananella felis TaxID=3231492 RepID=UPI0035270716
MNTKAEKGNSYWIRVSQTFPPGDLKWVLGAWLTSRTLLFSTALMIGIKKNIPLLEVVRQWDVVHFLNIAELGYPTVDPNLVAFFPGLPISIWFLSKLGFSPSVAGLIIANLSALLAALALTKLAGRTAGVLWLFGPAMIFGFVPYTEAPFAAAFFWAWERARAGKWASVSALSAVAVTFRVTGVVAAIALVVMGFVEGRNWTEKLKPIAWMMLPAAAAAAYQIYIWRLSGDILGWVHAQSRGWSRSFHWPWEAFKVTWDNASPYVSPDYYRLFRLEALAVVVCIILVAYLPVRKWWPEAVFMLLNLAMFSFSDFYMSLARSMVYWLPLWLLAAEALTGVSPASGMAPPSGNGVCWPNQAIYTPARKVAIAATVVFSAGAMLWWAGIFLDGAWAG